MKVALILVASLLVLQGSWAQEACDPATAGTGLIDLITPIGELACKVPPSVDLAKTMGRLTGTLKNLDASQLKQLPALLTLLGDTDPTALAPFLALSSDELSRTIPLLSEVPVETLKVALPLLAKQDIAVIQKMIKFLKLVPLSKLQQLSPLFSRLTEGQARVLQHALNILPSHAVDALIAMVQALGPVTDAGVAVKQHFGLFPNVRITTNKAASSSATAGATASGSGSVSFSHGGSGSVNVNKAVSFMPSIRVTSSPVAVSQSSGKGVTFKIGGRKLAQATAQGCDPSARGADIGIALLGDFGPVVCKFGPDALKPVLQQTIDILLKQTPEQLARLPQLADALANVDPAILGAVSSIPQSTLQALLPVLSGIDPAKLTAQLKLLGQQDKETLDKMVFFLKSTPGSQFELLIGVFAQLSDKQIEQMAKLLNALSPGQIFLTIHLLDTFGFAVDAIGQHIPAQSQRGSNGFMIGPVKVVYDKN